MRKRDVAMYAPYCYGDQRSSDVLRLCIAIPVHKKNTELDDIQIQEPTLVGNNIIIDFHVPDHRAEESIGVHFFAEDIQVKSTDFNLTTLAGLNILLRVHISGGKQMNSVAFSTEQNNILHPLGSESRSTTSGDETITAIIHPLGSESRSATEADNIHPLGSESR
jgi:hypothetical protein